MHTSQAAGLVDAMTAKMNPEGLQREFKSGMSREALAIRLAGKFKTAFPGGKPGDAAATNAPGAGATNTPPTPASLKEGNGEGRVVLVGDVDPLRTYAEGDSVRFSTRGWVASQSFRYLEFTGGHWVELTHPDLQWDWFCQFARRLDPIERFRLRPALP